MTYFFKKQWPVITIVLVFCLTSFIYQEVAFSQKLIALPLTIAPKSSTLASPSTAQVEINSPIRLIIPKVKVDATIEYVGLTSTGAMGVPKKITDVAWFNLGTIPGEIGSAVIAGHLDGKNGQKAIFYDLKKLKKGDLLFIKDNQGKIITFVVKELRLYNSEAAVPEVFSSNQGVHLNLITCAGNWSKSKKNYAQRLVVFTDLK
jgi:LPXTG-site transpeptidase (sortase) family protein